MKILKYILTFSKFYDYNIFGMPRNHKGLYLFFFWIFPNPFPNKLNNGKGIDPIMPNWYLNYDLYLKRLCRCHLNNLIIIEHLEKEDLPRAKNSWMINLKEVGC